MRAPHPIFRSTETQTYLTCPTLWWQLRSGWRKRNWGSREIAALIGRSIHHGTTILDEHATVPERRGVLDVAILEALKIFEGDCRAELRGDNETKVAADRLRKGPKEIAEALSVYAEANVLHEHDVELLATEMKYHASTLDRVIRMRDTGELGTADLKTKTFSQPYFKYEYTRDFGTSWQMYQYLYELTLQFGEPATTVFLILLDLKEMKVEWVPYYVSDIALAQWAVGARQVWQDMAGCIAGDRAINQVAAHSTRYGQCELYNLCFKGVGKDVPLIHTGTNPFEMLTIEEGG